MVLPINAALKNLPVYQPGRPIEEVARELGLPAETIIKLASNENPFGPSPLALAAMQKALAGVNLYPDGNAFYLKQKLAGKLGVEPAHLIFGNGSNEIIEFIGHALLAPGTDVAGVATLGSIDEGTFVDGKWVRGRRLNGDENDHDRAIDRVLRTAFRIFRIKLYQRM